MPSDGQQAINVPLNFNYGIKRSTTVPHG
jgi:hypothetical protein